MSTLSLYHYTVIVKGHENEWRGYGGFIFARDEATAVRLIEERFKISNISLGEEVWVNRIQQINIEEGVFL